MDRKLRNKLLDELDTVVNSNTFWITLDILEDEEFDITRTLIQHLKTGSFHYEIVKQDVERGWTHYSQLIFSDLQEPPIPVLLQRPGNIWNGNTGFTIKQPTKVQVIELLTDILIGGKKVFSSTHSTVKTLPKDEAEKLATDLIDMLDIMDENWQAYNIKPDFLNTVGEDERSGYTVLGYFENGGRDLALAFKADDELHLLLTNGYG